MIHPDFLLRSDTARGLYHRHAEALPIIDYHNHLSAEDLADDRTFPNITQLWICGDPYKHRAMRIVGVPERLITGESSDREKFDAWAATVPQTLGNPLFHWTALELKRYFGISELLSPETADLVWETCNSRLQSSDFSARGLLTQANVECICTSDPLRSKLEAHARLANSDFPTRVLPSLRIDDITSLDDLMGQLDLFAKMGCRLADHSVVDFSTLELRALASEYHLRGWTLQLHIGDLGKACDIAGLRHMFDNAEKAGHLPRTILYPLNPADNAALAVLSGSFSEDGVRGKIQLGPAWWYNDHALGIRQHLDSLANYGLLSTFIGVTTDSRSPLSMVRHEYFRRIFCDWLGDQAESGAFPDDEELLGGFVRDVCYDNARHWLA